MRCLLILICTAFVNSQIVDVHVNVQSDNEANSENISDRSLGNTQTMCVDDGTCASNGGRCMSGPSIRGGHSFPDHIDPLGSNSSLVQNNIAKGCSRTNSKNQDIMCACVGHELTKLVETKIRVEELEEKKPDQDTLATIERLEATMRDELQNMKINFSMPGHAQPNPASFDDKAPCGKGCYYYCAALIPLLFCKCRCCRCVWWEWVQNAPICGFNEATYSNLYNSGNLLPCEKPYEWNCGFPPPDSLYCPDYRGQST